MIGRKITDLAAQIPNGKWSEHLPSCPHPEGAFSRTPGRGWQSFGTKMLRLPPPPFQGTNACCARLGMLPMPRGLLGFLGGRGTVDGTGWPLDATPRPLSQQPDIHSGRGLQGVAVPLSLCSRLAHPKGAGLGVPDRLRPAPRATCCVFRNFVSGPLNETSLKIKSHGPPPGLPWTTTCPPTDHHLASHGPPPGLLRSPVTPGDFSLLDLMAGVWGACIWETSKRSWKKCVFLFNSVFP